MAPTMTRLAILISSFFYSGYFPVAPGTAGSAAALVLYVLVRWSASPVIEAAVIAAVAVVGTWSASVTERHLHSTDPGQIVIDEVLGMLLTVAFLPLHWQGVLLGFFVFRALDIVKPFPANVAERLHGGLGVMADDAVAGLYGNLLMRAALWVLPAWL
jgi:phosphatidylglycerophosphatase A